MITWLSNDPKAWPFIGAVEEMDLEPFERRVCDEWHVLMAKITKLQAFINPKCKTPDVDKGLSHMEFHLLLSQLTAMQTYAELLAARISHFGLKRSQPAAHLADQGAPADGDGN